MQKCKLLVGALFRQRHRAALYHRHLVVYCENYEIVSVLFYWTTNIILIYPIIFCSVYFSGIQYWSFLHMCVKWRSQMKELTLAILQHCCIWVFLYCHWFFLQDTAIGSFLYCHWFFLYCHWFFLYCHWFFLQASAIGSFLYCRWFFLYCHFATH